MQSQDEMLNDVMHDVYINSKSYDDVQERLVRAFSQVSCDSFQDYISRFIDQYIKVVLDDSIQRVKKVLNDLIKRINTAQRSSNDLILHFVEKLAQAYEKIEKIGLEVSKLISYYNQCSKDKLFPNNFKTKEIHRSQFIKRVLFDEQYYLLIERAKNLFQEHSVMEKYQKAYGQLEKIKDIVEQNRREMPIIQYNGTYDEFLDDSFDEELTSNTIQYNVQISELDDSDMIQDDQLKKKKKRRKNKHQKIEQFKTEIQCIEHIIRSRISDDELEQYLLDTDNFNNKTSNEIKDFEKRLELSSLSLTEDQKFKPNITSDWVKKLRERIQRARKQIA